MQVAGYKGTPIFNWKLIKHIHRCSRGVPRLVNMLRHKMMLLAYGEGRHKLTNHDLRFAVKDTEDTRLESGRWLPLTIGIAAMCLLIAAWATGKSTEGGL